MEHNTCTTCKYYEPFAGVCCNGASEHRADFMDESDGCPVWAAKTEYINRSAVLAYPTRADHCDKEHANEDFISGIESVMDFVEELPAADAVAVVRCGECKYRARGMAVAMCKNKLIGGGDSPVPYNHFCSYGKRREDNHDTAKQ